MTGWCSAVGWNCTNSRSATAAPARIAIAMPSPVDNAGLVVTANIWPAPPVASTVWRARTSWRAPSGPNATTPDAATVVDEQVGGEPPLPHLDPVECDDRRHERPLDLGARRVTTRVDDAGQGVTSFACQRERGGLAVAGAVEHRAERHQVPHPVGTLRHEHAHCVGVAQPALRR